MDKYSVILSAYECSPDHGSEAGVGTGSVVEKDVPDGEFGQVTQPKRYMQLR